MSEIELWLDEKEMMLQQRGLTKDRAKEKGAPSSLAIVTEELAVYQKACEELIFRLTTVAHTLD